MTYGPDVFYGPGFALILLILLYVGLAVLGFWVLYTVIWRAVRRGLASRRAP